MNKNEYKEFQMPWRTHYFLTAIVALVTAHGQRVDAVPLDNKGVTSF